MFQSLPPPCSTVWADINTEMRMTSSYVQQIIINDMILTQPDSFIFFFLGSSPFCFSLWFCALVIWPSRLYSHCEAEEQKDGSNSFCATPQAMLFFPSAHYLQTRLGISAGHRSLLFWPKPTVLQGAEVSGRPTSDSVSATRKHPRHSTPPPEKTAKKKDGSLTVSRSHPK